MGIGKVAKQVLADDENVTLIESTPLVFVHLAALIGVFFVGISPVAVAACLVTYLVRVFALTGGYHRYFSHRTYQTSRVFQFILAFVGASAAQLGPIWWASHHRHHHEHSDTEHDVHSAKMKGVFWSHIGWVMCRKYRAPNEKGMQDLTRYPELRFIDRFNIIAPLSLGLGLYALGDWMATAHPALGTTGWQMVIWGFFVSTVFVYHVTFCINSVTHIFGAQRFNTRDESRNHFLLALLTMGEGWHNNHHRYPMSTRQGLYWWEIDITYYVLRFLALFRIVWGIRTHPASIYSEADRLKAEARHGEGKQTTA